MSKNIGVRIQRRNSQCRNRNSCKKHNLLNRTSNELKPLPNTIWTTSSVVMGTLFTIVKQPGRLATNGKTRNHGHLTWFCIQVHQVHLCFKSLTNSYMNVISNITFNSKFY